MSMPNFHEAMVVDRQMDQTRGHNVVLFPAARWQRDLVQRAEARGALADALIAGRVNLLHAGEGFRDLDARSPNFDLAAEVVSKLETDLERLISSGEQFSAVSSQMPSWDNEPKRMTRIPPQPYIPTHE